MEICEIEINYDELTALLKKAELQVKELDLTLKEIQQFKLKITERVPTDI